MEKKCVRVGLRVAADKRITPVLTITESGELNPEHFILDLIRTRSQGDDTEEITKPIQTDDDLSKFIGNRLMAAALSDINESLGEGESDKPKTRSDFYGWGDGLYKTDQKIGPFVPLIWHQNAPFVDYTRNMIGPQAVYAGCYAVAMAMIIAYNQHPTTGWTFTDQYTRIRRVRSYLSGTYTEGSSYDAEWASNLIAWCNRKLKPEYKSTGTFTLDKNVAPVFMEFGYTSAIDLQWESFLESLIINDILSIFLPQKYPVFYMAKTSSGSGHGWILDGIWYLSNAELGNNRKIKFYHANLGWNGKQNGWYSPSSLAPINILFKYESILGDYGTGNLEYKSSARIVFPEP